MPALVDAGYRCICLDLRGHGWTDAPPDGYEKEQFASDVLADARRARRRALQADRPRLGRLRVVPDRAARAGARREAARAVDRPSVDPPRGRHRASSSRRWPARRTSSCSPLPSSGSNVVRRLPFIDTIIKVGSGGRVPADVREKYASRFKEPDRARGTSALYRTFLLRELQPILKGRYRDRRLTVPTVLMFGDSRPRHHRATAGGLRGARRRHAPREGHRRRPLPARTSSPRSSPSRRSRCSAADAHARCSNQRLRTRSKNTTTLRPFSSTHSK